jgi:glycosyltransferase involved in cell wall biosynthesis
VTAFRASAPVVSVVLPVYRNRSQLDELYRRLTGALDPLPGDHQLVFVDDDGRDGSLEWLRECRARDARVRLVEMPGNAGQHQAVLAGLRATTGDVVAVMDADLQDPPEALPLLVGALRGECAVVFARRVSRHQSAGRHVTGRLFKRLVRRIAGSRVPPGTGMFFVATRQAVDAALARAEGARYVPLLFDHAGASMTAVEVTKELRRDTPSAYTGWRRLHLAVGALRQALASRRTGRRPSSTVRASDAGQGEALAREQDQADRH